MRESQRYAKFRSNPNGDIPQVDPTAFVDPSASIIGNVKIGARVYVGPQAVIRADEMGKDGQVSPIILEEECNIQDGVIVHAVAGSEVRIGKRVFVSHGCIIHGPCTIEKDSFLGFRVTVFNANLGEAVWVGACSTILETSIDSHTMVPASRMIHSPDQTNQLHPISSDQEEFRRETIEMGQRLRQGYFDLFRKE